MTKEFLETLGITDEQRKSIQEESGKDIERYKQAAIKAEAERDDLKGRLAERDKDLESLKSSGKDTEAARKQLDELQSKYKADTDKYQADIAERDYNAAVKELFSDYKFASDLARNGAISAFKSEGHKLEDGKFKMGKAWLDSLKKDQPTAFISDEKPPSFSASTQGSADLGKEPKTYSQMIEALQTNPNAKF